MEELISELGERQLRSFIALVHPKQLDLRVSLLSTTG
jgi:hypothetical protein